MNPQASLKKILLTDYWAFLGWMTPVTYLGLIVLQFFLGETLEVILRLALVLLPLSLAGLALAFWRVRLIRRVIEEGVQMPATIVRASFFRGRGRVEVVYTYQGERVVSGNVVMKNKLTSAFQLGTPVTVMVDREKPRRAFVRKLYAEE